LTTLWPCCSRTVTGPGLCGITTVAGNVGLDLTTANALRVREYAGLGEVPVVAGCARRCCGR